MEIGKTSKNGILIEHAQLQLPLTGYSKSQITTTKTTPFETPNNFTCSGDYFNLIFKKLWINRQLSNDFYVIVKRSDKDTLL
ncbi:hypothetical protein D1818_11945 [Aquimarina sp. BL5]|uniref:hypothetical protein n=1 Tax=Aquimarina sp. BL5 TaxID=1714860 RepID=UPI000E52D558|nr:hypothetical protein [Aquimarina sp. BL5]AXT51508.1 hypothetical protein D1818_11945 [Aquimarina sp. BL5]RKN06923.1 hypothetical protein D7036_08325 [Aquimarina sp. BL5]